MVLTNLWLCEIILSRIQKILRIQFLTNLWLIRNSLTVLTNSVSFFLNTFYLFFKIYTFFLTNPVSTILFVITKEFMNYKECVTMKEKHSFKVLFCLSLILVLVLVACGESDSINNENSEDTNNSVNLVGFPIVDEPITMSMMAPGTGMINWEDMPFFTYMAEKTNINFDFITPPLDDFSTSLNLAFASGNLADIIFGAGSNNLTRSMEIEYGTQGILIPLEGYIETYAPNLYALMEQYPEIRRNITAPDGHIYSLPSVMRGNNSLWRVGPLWYNGAWMEALDAEVPTTIDEFFDLMVRFRDEEPAGPGVETFPISNADQMRWMRGYLSAAFGMTSLQAGIEEVDGVVRHNAMTDNYRAFLEWMHMLHEEGILHPESFTMSGDAHNALAGQNQVGLFQQWFPFFATGQTDVESTNNPMFRPLTSEWAPTPLMPSSARMTTGVFAITSSNQNPAAAIRWVDQFYTAEGGLLMGDGPEGYLWEYQENDAGEQVRVFVEGIDLEDPESERGRITPDFGIPVPILGFDRPGILRDRNEDPDTRFWDFITEQTELNFVPYQVVDFPLAGLTQEEAGIVSVIQTDLETFLIEAEARFITGGEPINDETWASFQEMLERLRIQELVDLYQVVFDRWASS